jgi:hypothetical protein
MWGEGPGQSLALALGGGKGEGNPEGEAGGWAKPGVKCYKPAGKTQLLEEMKDVTLMVVTISQVCLSPDSPSPTH